MVILVLANVSVALALLLDGFEYHSEENILVVTTDLVTVALLRESAASDDGDHGVAVTGKE